jgi:hypothetical protein
VLLNLILRWWIDESPYLISNDQEVKLFNPAEGCLSPIEEGDEEMFKSSTLSRKLSLFQLLRGKPILLASFITIVIGGVFSGSVALCFSLLYLVLTLQMISVWFMGKDI